MDHRRIANLFSLEGRTAIVTGGSRGIGLALAEGFADAGANVVVASRKADAVEAAVQAIVARGGEAAGRATHLGKIDEVQALVDFTVETFGGIDIVVNNAATALALPLGHLTLDAWEKVFDVDLKGPVFLVEAALPHLAKSGRGSIINVLSAGAFLPNANGSMYSAAKAALLSFTRSMAHAYVGQGIRVNALAPGTVDTDMVRNNPPEAQERMALASPMARMAAPEEMLGPALLLASDAGSFMTGECIHADGGMLVAR